MQIIRVKNYEELSKKAAKILASIITLNPEAVLGLATGSTPVGAYQELIRLHREEGLDFSSISTVNLDEYLGLDGSHDQSYRYFMNQQLFDHVNIHIEQTFVPSGVSSDSQAACTEYDARIEDFCGTDVQVLGIGGNGHIGFNEPADHFIRETHIVDLAEDTREANARFFSSIEEVPTQAITMGMGGIFSSQKILLLASGKGKAQAIKDTVLGPITPQVPASLLQLHPDVILIADEDALSLL